jgi:hypothetical protein
LQPFFFFKNNGKGSYRGGERKVDFILNLSNTGFPREKTEKREDPGKTHKGKK